MVAQQEAAPEAEAGEEKALKGRVSRGRVRTTPVANAAAEMLAGGKATTDVATAGTGFRPSAEAAAAASEGDEGDEGDEPIVDRAGGFAEPPPAAPAPPAGKRDPKDILAAARAKFTGAR
jgi:hypothetical protein